MGEGGRKPGSVEELMRLSACAQAAGVSRQTVEYYIMIGLIEPISLPHRYGRFFDRRLVRRVRLIRKLNRSGYTLRAIREIYLERSRKAPR